MAREVRCGRVKSRYSSRAAFASPPPLGKARDLHDAHRAVERQRDDIAVADRMARGAKARAVDAHMAGFDEGCGVAARAQHARVPQPFVDALSIQASCAYLLVAFELLLERGEFGER